MTTVTNEASNPFEMAAEIFLSQSSAIVRGGLALSLSVTIEPDQLQALVRRLWPDTALTEVELSELIDWPFVIAGQSGWSMLQPMARVLSTYFRDADQVLFTSAHELLASMEKSRTPSDELDDWFISGRTAYYLAGVDPTVSAGQFGEVFEHAPVVDRTSCRVWLAGLVDRQSHLLGDTSRTVSFFRGFRHYVSGNRRAAAREFTRVLAGEDADIYRAISLHLGALSIRSQMAENVVDMIRQSVELSEKLRLGVNEVMARQSLIWLLLRHGTPKTDLISLAEYNVERSKSLADRNLLGWTRRTYAVMQWLNLVGDTRDHVTEEARSEAPSLLGDLSEALALAEATDDPETVLFILNDRASIFCDLAELEDAEIELEAALDRAGGLGYASRVLASLGKTCGRAAILARSAGKNNLATQFRRLSSGFRRLEDRYVS